MEIFDNLSPGSLQQRMASGLVRNYNYTVQLNHVSTWDSQGDKPHTECYTSVFSADATFRTVASTLFQQASITFMTISWNRPAGFHIVSYSDTHMCVGVHGGNHLWERSHSLFSVLLHDLKVHRGLRQVKHILRFRVQQTPVHNFVELLRPKIQRA